MISSEIYPIEKEVENKKTIWEHYFARKIAFVIAPIFLKLGISANQVSFLAIFCGAIAAVLIATGDYLTIIYGSLLMQLWIVLDKTDGIIARSRKEITNLGKLLEELDGDVIAILFFSGIGIAASKLPGFLPSCCDVPPHLFIVFGILTSLFIIFRHLMNRHFQALFTEKNEGHSFESGKTSFLYGITLKFLGVYSLAQPILVLAAIFNFLGLYVIVYFLSHGLVMAVSVTHLILKANKNDFRQ